MIKKVLPGACMIVLTTILSFIYLTKASAQNTNLNSFTGLKCYGAMPDDFRNSIKIRDHENIPRDDRKTRKPANSNEKFDAMSGYYINELLLSGDVVYGDPISRYANKVADSLLKGMPDLRKMIRIYVTKSEYCNAYSTDEGIIFLNVGLIARMENEAQLAYVLAHEIVHFVRKHNISLYLEKEKAGKKKDRSSQYRNMSVSEKLLMINFRSRAIETQADREGLLMYFSKSNYDISQSVNVLNIMLYSAYPFTNEPFDYSILETKEMKIPAEFLTWDISNRLVDEDMADSLSTHPNVKTRRANIQALLDSIPHNGNQKFIHNRDEFDNIVALARFEVIRQLLIDHRYDEALYCASVMLKKYPLNEFLRKSCAAALYGVSSYKNKTNHAKVTEDYKKVKGEMAQVSKILNRMGKKELNIIALGYVYRVYRDYPEDKYLKKICGDLFADLVGSNDVTPAYFYSKSLDELHREQGQNQNGSGNQNKQSSSWRSPLEESFTHFAFVDLMKDSSFVRDFGYYYNKRDSVVASNLYSFHYKYRIARKHIVGIKRVVVCDPHYVKLDTRRKHQDNFQESEDREAKMKKLLIENAAKTGLQIYIANARADSLGDERSFNDMSAVNEYVRDRLNQAHDGVLQSYCYQNIDSLMAANQTHFLSWVYTISVVERKPVLKLIGLSLMPYMWPYTISKFCVPNIKTYYYYVLFDVNTGKVARIKARKTEGPMREDQMNIQFYNFLLSTKRCYEI